jgi:transcriptional regulator with XRE-family HTH domain
MYPWVENLREQLKAKGWSLEDLAAETGISLENIKKYHQGKVENPRGDAMRRLARAFDMSEVRFRGATTEYAPRVPKVGYVGAGEQFVFIDPIEEGRVHDLDMVRFELDAKDPIAVEVRGMSNAPVYRPGDILFCSRHQSVDREAFINKDCVLRLDNGEGYIKRVTAGTRPSRFTLMSYAANPMVNVTLAWAAPVQWIKRAGS